MAYADQEMSGSRIVAIIIVALIHIALGYALITGLAYSAFQQVVERVTTVDIEEPEEELPEEELPEPEPETAPPPPVAPPPPINIAPAPPPIRVQPNIPPPTPVIRTVPTAAPVGVPPPPPPPPPPPSQARPVSRDGFSRWSSRIQEAYPARAIRQELEGNVGVSVVVGADGRVTSCSVTASSGESILDEAACDGMQRYARYEPALNDAGQPTTGRDALTIVYQLGE